MIYQDEKGDITMALTGDALITRRMSVFKEKRFMDVVQLLRGADVAFTNAEVTFHNYEVPPTLTPGGGYMAAHPQMAKELQWMGINIVACANNHSYDFGEAGILATINNLDAVGLVHAGTGRNLAEARMPAYLETNNGRVALISACSSGPPGMLAGEQWRDTIGRPGVNAIRSVTVQYVDNTTFNILRTLNERIRTASSDYLTRVHYARRPPKVWGDIGLEDTASQFYMVDFRPWSQYPEPGGVMIAQGNNFERRLLPYKEDIEGNLQRIREARRMAGWVIVTMHDHDEGKTPDDPSDVAVSFGKAAVDEGADVFVVHGPHRDRGIEIYKGRPILYSLGHLIHQSDTVLRMPRDNMIRSGLGWEATTPDFFDNRAGREDIGEFKGMAAEPFRWRNAIALLEFLKGKLTAIRLYPIDLGFKRRRFQRGRPVMAEGEEAQEVLELYKRTSAAFGTKVEISDGVGLIKVNS